MCMIICVLCDFGVEVDDDGLGMMFFIVYVIGVVDGGEL